MYIVESTLYFRRYTAQALAALPVDQPAGAEQGQPSGGCGSLGNAPCAVCRLWQLSDSLLLPFYNPALQVDRWRPKSIDRHDGNLGIKKCPPD